jgi:hypothetical protein
MSHKDNVWRFKDFGISLGIHSLKSEEPLSQVYQWLGRTKASLPVKGRHTRQTKVYFQPPKQCTHLRSTSRRHTRQTSKCLFQPWKRIVQKKSFAVLEMHLRSTLLSKFTSRFRVDSKLSLLVGYKYTVVRTSCRVTNRLHRSTQKCIELY